MYNPLLIKILPIILIFVLGYFLRRIHLLTKESGDLFLKVVFYVSLPALIVLSVIDTKLSVDFIYLPFIAVSIIALTYGVAYLFGRLLHLPNPSLGVFLIGSMIINVGFILPFVIATYGDEGLARISLFDFGNGLIVYTFVYYIAHKYGTEKKSRKIVLKKIVGSIPLWAILLAVSFNLSKTQLPLVVNNFLELMGAMTTPLIMLSLGVYFSPKIEKFTPLALAVIIRMGFGLLLGFLFVTLFNLEGLTRTIVLLCSAAPVGYNTLTFSSLEKLDKEFAASLVSFSIIIGIIIIPILMLALY